MISKHLFKVILGFCGVILIGLISLVLLNSFKNKNNMTVKATSPVQAADTIKQPIKPYTKTPVKKPNTN